MKVHTQVATVLCIITTIKCTTPQFVFQWCCLCVIFFSRFNLRICLLLFYLPHQPIDDHSIHLEFTHYIRYETLPRTILQCQYTSIILREKRTKLCKHINDGSVDRTIDRSIGFLFSWIAFVCVLFLSFGFKYVMFTMLKHTNVQENAFTQD